MEGAEWGPSLRVRVVRLPYATFGVVLRMHPKLAMKRANTNLLQVRDLLWKRELMLRRSQTDESESATRVRFNIETGSGCSLGTRRQLGGDAARLS